MKLIIKPMVVDANHMSEYMHLLKGSILTKIWKTREKLIKDNLSYYPILYGLMHLKNNFFFLIGLNLIWIKWSNLR